MLKRFPFIVILTGFLAGCVTTRPIPTPPSASFVPPPVSSATRFSALVRLDPQEIPLFQDDLDTPSLRTAAFQSLTYYRGLPQDQLFILGTDSYTARDLESSMTSLIDLLDHASSTSEWLSAVRRTFVVYQSIGTDAEKTVTFSSYYEPTIHARLTKDNVYRFPLYARPADLIDVDLGLFDPTRQGARISGRREGKALVPYPTRADIDSRHALKEKGLEIAWAQDPLDVLDLQIEGSGWLDLGGKDVRRIRYDGDNGRRYKSVGQYVIATGRIPAKVFSRQAFLRYMGEHPQERQALLNVDERYIFFRIDTSTSAPYAYGNLDVPLTAGRSMATDPKLFPKGALAWIWVGNAPANGLSALTSKDKGQDKTPLQRFMVNQDEGGAIQGPGRVDIFAGHGADAGHFATHFWNSGKLYFLVKRKPSSES